VQEAVDLKNRILAERTIRATLKEMGVEQSEGEIPKKVARELSVALFKLPKHSLLEQFEAEYERRFSGLVREARRVKTKLVVFYVPSEEHSRELGRTFFRALAVKYGVDYIDMTEAFAGYPREVLTLHPVNAHLSPYGYRIIAERLSRYVAANADYRSGFLYETRPRLLADLKPGVHRVDTGHARLPFIYTTNTQGFRRNQEVSFPKKGLRILCLGDSYTFGAYVHDHDTYPSQLERLLPSMEVINAGNVGYTISDEASLFIERAKYVEPDITILQALDNDLFDFFFFKRNQFNRKGRSFAPSSIEEKFIREHLGDGDHFPSWPTGG